MKEINSEVPQELLQQIEILNSLYNLFLKQKAYIEQADYENLFTTTSDFNEINKVIQTQRQKLTVIEEHNISQNVQQRINELIDQLNNLTKEVLSIENQNCCMLEISQQKMGEALNEICCNIS